MQNKANQNHTEYQAQECGHCKYDEFEIKIRYGSGGSGTYFRFTCVACKVYFDIDFENPDYEG